MNNAKILKKSITSFTVDPEPSYTNPSQTSQLLNRNHVSLPPSSKSKVTKIAPEPTQSTQQTTQTRIQPSTRKRSFQNLILWDSDTLRHTPDPLGKAILSMVDQGATSALFLSIIPPPQGQSMPHFLSSAVLSPGNKFSFWTGLEWDPSIVPELWNRFIKKGFLELGPHQNPSINHSNLVRTAFGVLANEWLLIVRAGPLDACRGIVALVSKESLGASSNLSLEAFWKNGNH